MRPFWPRGGWVSARGRRRGFIRPIEICSQAPPSVLGSATATVRSLSFISQRWTIDPGPDRMDALLGLLEVWWWTRWFQRHIIIKKSAVLFWSSVQKWTILIKSVKANKLISGLGCHARHDMTCNVSGFARLWKTVFVQGLSCPVLSLIFCVFLMVSVLCL